MTDVEGSVLAARTLVVALLVAASVTACGVVGPRLGGVGDRPGNPKAIAPIVLVAQGTGPAGDYKVWAFHTADGMACLEVDSTTGASAGCDPTGSRPLGGGVGRNAAGVVVDASTAVASAATAVLHDASAADVRVALVQVGPMLPGVKVAIFNLGPAANPARVDFLDAVGSNVDSVRFP